MAQLHLLKVTSGSGPQHESFNSRVVPASSRSGLGVIASAGFNSFDSGVETVPAPGLCAVFRGAHRVCSGGSEIVHLTAGETEGISGLREVFESESKNAEAAGAPATAGEYEGITGLLEVCESDSMKTEAAGAPVTAGVREGFLELHEVRESALRMRPGAVVASATAGECEGIFGSRSSVETHCLFSSWGVDVVACARVSAVPGVSATASSSASAPASFAGVAHARSSPMRDAHNSWSDTAVNSLRVQRSTSYNLQGL